MEGMNDPAPFAARACIMIISWNGRDNLRSCLKSCFSQDYPEYDVIVLDNASTDGSSEMVRAEYPKARLLPNRVNIGFTGAGNAGMKYAAGEGYRYALLLANDIVLDSRCLSGAIKYSVQNPTAGMIGFRLLGASSYVPLEELDKASKQWKELEAEDAKWIEGAAYLIDPCLFMRLGGYDETLFMYEDENDLEKRICKAGYSLRRINVPAWHNAGLNVMGSRKFHAAFYALRNILIIFYKENPLPKALRAYLPFIRTACDPRVRIAEDQIIVKRYRPSNFFVNIFVVAAAMISFLCIFSKIRGNKKIHNQLCEEERNKLRNLISASVGGGGH